MAINHTQTLMAPQEMALKRTSSDEPHKHYIDTPSPRPDEVAWVKIQGKQTPSTCGEINSLRACAELEGYAIGFDPLRDRGVNYKALSVEKVWF